MELQVLFMTISVRALLHVFLEQLHDSAMSVSANWLGQSCYISNYLRTAADEVFLHQDIPSLLYFDPRGRQWEKAIPGESKEAYICYQTAIKKKNSTLTKPYHPFGPRVKKTSNVVNKVSTRKSSNARATHRFIRWMLIKEPKVFWELIRKI